MTKKCENCTTRENCVSTMVIKLEHDVRSTFSWSSHRQFGFNFGIPSASSKSTVRTLASSFTPSGQTATTRHCNRRHVRSPFGFWISFSTRSYVMSRDSGNSLRVHRTLGGRHRRRVSSWQKTHQNLFEKVQQVSQV